MMPRTLNARWKQLGRRYGGVAALGAEVVIVLGILLCPSRIAAAPPGMNGTEILMLGTKGGPSLEEDRSETSTLLIVDGRPYLIDCGIGTIRRLVEAGVRSETIETIFLTHLHPDHALGLADVMANDFLRTGFSGRSQPINIYGPPQTNELVKAAFHYISIPFGVFATEDWSNATGEAIAVGAPNNGLKSPFVVHEIDGPGPVFQDDRISVTAAENTHYALMPSQFRSIFKSYSYRIRTPDGVVVFTGDTGPSDAVVQLAKGADVLVSEVTAGPPGELLDLVNRTAEQNHWRSSRTKAFLAHFKDEHLDTQGVGEIAAKAKVKAVILYHYLPGGKADPAAFVAGVKKYFAGPVFAPADLDRYCLRPPPRKPLSVRLELCQDQRAGP